MGGVYLRLQLEATFHHSEGSMAAGPRGCFSHLDRSQKDNTGAQVAFSFPPFHSFQDLDLGVVPPTLKYYHKYIESGTSLMP